MRTKLMIAIIALPMLAAPSAAQQSSSSGQAQSAKPAQAKEKKYCLRYENQTGSRLQPSVCKTKAQWAKDGVNVGD